MIRTKKKTFVRRPVGKKRDKKQIVPICFATNDNYAIYCAVAIQSIIEHASNEWFYDIYILYTKLSDHIKYRLEALSQKNLRITCVDVEDKLPKDLEAYEKFRYSPAMFYRFLIPHMFRKNDKVIYLDCDIICQVDIASLLDINLGQNIFGAVVEENMVPRDCQYIEDVLLLDSSNYFNSGVLLFNIKEWIINKLPDKCWKLLETANMRYRYPDQDILNIVCQNNFLKLDFNWNYLWHCRHIGLNDSFEDIKIIHYSSNLKPWDISKVLSEVWWSYAKKSPFYEAILFKKGQVNENK